MPVWLEMLLGAVLGFCGAGMALRARPGPNQKLFYVAGAAMALIGVYLLLSNLLS